VETGFQSKYLKGSIGKISPVASQRSLGTYYKLWNLNMSCFKC